MEKEKGPNPSSDNKISWSDQALHRVEDAPDFVKPGIYKLMVKRAQERGKK